MEGDACAAFLFAVTADQEARLGDTLCRRFAGREFPSEASRFHLTVSVGVAALPPGEPYGNLLEAAKTASLQANQGGRNRLVAR